MSQIYCSLGYKRYCVGVRPVEPAGRLWRGGLHGRPQLYDDRGQLGGWRGCERPPQAPRDGEDKPPASGGGKLTFSEGSDFVLLAAHFVIPIVATMNTKNIATADTFNVSFVGNVNTNTRDSSSSESTDSETEDLQRRFL